MNNDNLFNQIRNICGKLNQLQVNCVNAILSSCQKHQITDIRHVAYILATGCHESQFLPVEENLASRAGRPYNIPDPVTKKIYFGRGCPTQITHKGNYATFGKLIGLDLVKFPEFALQTDIGAEIGAIGMKLGMFTGVSLSKYFNEKLSDPLNARRIINGTDKAELIKSYYERFYQTLSAT